MRTSNYEETGNIHLDMELTDTLPYHEVIGGLILKYADESSAVLDIGCGLGHIGSVVFETNPKIKVDIADAYDACLQATAKRGNIGKQYKIDELKFNIVSIVDKKYDVIVMSHVLEHLIFPAKAIDDVLQLLNDGGKLIVAVPNPVRPSVFVTNLFKSHYVNRGHVHSWDPSHWKNFLEVIMGLKVVQYKTDYIQLPRATRSGLMRNIGKFLVKAAPWWGFSNIAVIEKQSTNESLYNSWKDS